MRDSSSRPRHLEKLRGQEKVLGKYILSEADKLKQRHREYLRLLDDSVKRKERRLGAQLEKRVRTPEWWGLDAKFNPFVVTSRSNLQRYAHTIWRKILDDSYQTEPALVREVPKASGGTRQITVFQVPDSALSTMVYRSLTAKNVSRLSSRAYAYRPDRSAHDAVYSIHHEWRQLKRVYVAEFDFSRFFDEIDHEAIWRTLDLGPFLASAEERHVIRAFLSSRCANLAQYRKGAFTARSRGIPQGTSASLFLANLVCWELDRELERLGVDFARYADDTLIWSSDYKRVVDAFQVIDRYSRHIGVPLNLKKSDGINLVTNSDLAGEITSKAHVDFLGYRLSLNQICINPTNVGKAKRRISYLVYQNLVQAPKRGLFNTGRIGGQVDLDFIVALAQVRSYLYGGLTHKKLMEYIRGVSRKIDFRGFMSYYPIVTDMEQLKTLDGWVLSTFKNALRLRARLWQAHSGAQLPGPQPNWIEMLEELGDFETGGTVYDLRVPRFSLIGRALAQSVEQRGIRATANPTAAYY